MLTFPASRTPLPYLHPLLVQHNGLRPQRTRLHTNRAILSARPQARILMPDCNPHIDIIRQRRLQRPRRTVIHAIQTAAHHARHRIRLDIRKPLSLIPREIDLDRMGRANPHAFAASAARRAKLLLMQSPGRAQPVPHRPGGRNGLFQLSQLFRRLLQWSKGPPQRLHQLQQPLPKKSPPGDWLIFIIAHHLQS